MQRRKLLKQKCYITIAINKIAKIEFYVNWYAKKKKNKDITNKFKINH